MFKNYIKIAWRNLRKRPLYAGINIFGLFAGIAFALLIGAYVWQEYQVNEDLKNAENQYILTSQWKEANRGVDFATLGPPAEMLKELYPHLVSSYYRWDGIQSVVINGDKKFREGIQLGDDSLLNQFGFKLLDGNVQDVFSEPYSVVITKEKAVKYFGKTDVIGQVLSIENFSGELRNFKITAVLDDIKENSITYINKEYNGLFIAKNSADFFDRADFKNWELPIFLSFVELHPDVSSKDLVQPLNDILNKHAPDGIKENLSIIPVPLTEYYLNKNDGLIKNMLYTLLSIGLFIVIMAVINYINIAISFSSTRMREIGIRKVLGGKKKQLIFQFLAESTILVSIATVLAIVAYPFLSDVFEQVIGKDIIPLSAFPSSAVYLPLAIIGAVSLLAGVYPAFVLSNLQPIKSLKGKFQINSKEVIIRKLLVGFQFTVALVVLIGTFLITKQIDYFFGKDLGYEKEFLISAAVPRDWTEAGVQKMKTIRNELETLPEVTHVSLSYEVPNGNNGFQVALYRPGSSPESQIATQALMIDNNFLSTYQIPLVQGDVFNEARVDANAVLINKQATKLLHFKTPDMAIGKQIHIANQDNPLKIKGVVDDFHFDSLHTQIKPQIFYNVNAMHTYRYLSMRLAPGNIEGTIKQVEQKWQELMPNAPFEFNFMDDTLATLYTNEVQLQKASYSASILAFIIVLLGVFGLVSLSIHKRIKEIGVRKVLGASKQDISKLFMKDFAVIISVTALIAVPVAFYLIKLWLQNYVYQTSIGYSAFLWAVLIISGITLLLILVQTSWVSSKAQIKNLNTE